MSQQQQKMATIASKNFIWSVLAKISGISIQGMGVSTKNSSAFAVVINWGAILRNLIALVAVGLVVLLGWGIYELGCIVVSFIASYWQFILAGLATVGMIWLFIAKKAWQSIPNLTPAKWNSPRWLQYVLYVLAITAIVLLTLLCFRGCDSKKSGSSTVAVVTTQSFTKNFDNVVIARAYLDNVQDSTNKLRALVGFKYVDGKGVSDTTFDGRTYDEANKIIADEWKTTVCDNLSSNIKLSEQQLTVVTLAAMRMGKYGFERSQFLAEINKGNLKEAENWLLLQKADGTIRKVGEEPKQYFWLLRQLWKNNIHIEDLLQLPIWSYLSIPSEYMYDDKGNALWDHNLEISLKNGDLPTPAKALGLF